MPLTMNAMRKETHKPAENEFAQLIEAFGESYDLTRREREVLGLLLVWGMRNEDLSSVLHIASKTVKHHLASMMEKTRTRSSRELQALFLRSLLGRVAVVPL